MFSFMKRGRAKKSLAAAVRKIADGDSQTGRAEIDEALVVLGADGLSLVAEGLLEAGLHREGMEYVDRALAVDSPSWEDLATAVELAQHLEEGERVLELLVAMHEQRPSQASVAEALVRAWLSRADPTAALAVLDGMEEGNSSLIAARGEALLSLGRAEEALPVLQEALEDMEAEAGKPGGQARFDTLQSELAALVVLHDKATLEVHGDEGLARQVAERDALNAAAGRTGRQDAASRVRESEALFEDLELDDIDADEGEAVDLLFIDEADLRGLCLQGVAALRQARGRDALPLFVRALEVDDAHFPALLGHGAAVALLRGEMAARIWTLPEFPEPARLREVLPDYAVLGDLERRVVLASLHPLRATLPLLAQQGSVLRILPLDVRPQDHPGQAQATGQGPEGCQHEESMSGLSVASHAVMKVEDLLDVDPDHGWVLAHQFCHLLHLASPTTLARAVRPSSEPDDSSLAECLAFDYVESLCRRYDFVLPEDEEAARPEGLRFFDELSARDSLS